MSAPNVSDLRCPKCGGADHIEILASIWIRPTPDGPEIVPGEADPYNYGPETITTCEACQFVGRLQMF